MDYQKHDMSAHIFRSLLSMLPMGVDGTATGLNASLCMVLIKACQYPILMQNIS